jgi:hypothetical protein
VSLGVCLLDFSFALELLYNELMLITAFLFWWYGHGWIQQVGSVRDMLARNFDFFSIDLLARSLFSPFRQISAGKVQGSIQVIFQAWLDRVISRLIGAMLRTTIIFVGITSLLVMSLIAATRVLLWPLIPALPVIFVILMLSGWVPWKG